jgi:DNA polymerase-3 subunit delta
VAAVLVSGEDGVQVAQARGDLLKAMLGPGAEAEMRLDRLPAAELRREPARLLDALKAVGFFPGPRGVLVEEATDGLAPTMATALDAWGPGDARLVATGTGLTPKGGLRRLFEGRRDAVAITLYEDPPTEGELVDMLREAGLSRIEATAREELWGLALALPPGELRGLVERLSLHQVGREEALGAATVRALAPQAGEAELDDLLRAVTDGRRDRVAPLLALMAAQGVGSVAVAIAVSRHFRSLLAVVSDPGGAQAGVAALRPPAFGVRREALLRAAGAWRREQIEDGLRSLLELDLALRSGSAAPDRALVERALLRLATLRNG